jgi:hypothetical protein
MELLICSVSSCALSVLIVVPPVFVVLAVACDIHAERHLAKAGVASARGGVSPPLKRSDSESGEGAAQRRSAQAKRGRLGKPLAGARGGAPERTSHLRYKTDQRHGLQRSATATVPRYWATHDDVVCPGKRVGSWINVCSSCRVIRKKRCR